MKILRKRVNCRIFSEFWKLQKNTKKKKEQKRRKVKITFHLLANNFPSHDRTVKFLKLFTETNSTLSIIIHNTKTYARRLCIISLAAEQTRVSLKLISPDSRSTRLGPFLLLLLAIFDRKYGVAKK